MAGRKKKIRVEGKQGDKAAGEREQWKRKRGERVVKEKEQSSL